MLVEAGTVIVQGTSRMRDNFTVQSMCQFCAILSHPNHESSAAAMRTDSAYAGVLMLHACTLSDATHAIKNIACCMMRHSCVSDSPQRPRIGSRPAASRAGRR
jgi:hypothetical protein